MDFAANSFNQYQEPKIPIIIYQNYESAISKGWVKDEYATIATPSSIPPSPLLHNIPLNRQQKEETELGSSYKPFSTSMPNLTLNDDFIVAPIINKSLSLNDPVPLHNNHLNDSMSQLDLSGQSRPITPQLSNSGVSSTTTTESSLCSTPPPQFIFKKPSSSKNKRRSLFRKSKSKNSSFDFSHYNYKHMKFDKYGRWGKVLGSGIGGTVRLIHRALDDKPFAVKKFRNRFPQESEKSWLKSITAEFCIGSTLHHENIIETIDIIQERGQLHQIMEFAPYDLFEVVMSRQMTTNEINCCFKQIVLGINYLHNMGVAHLDLKLDNCVLNEFGTVKIIDFGCATVFKDPFSNKILFSSGPRGSDPYICPESYTRPSYDVRLADIWSLGIIYICMNTGRFPWLVAKVSEASYKAYLRYSDRLIKKLPLESRPIMKKFLEVVPEKRATLQDILEDEWFKNIECCVNDHRSTGHTHHLVGGGISE